MERRTRRWSRWAGRVSVALAMGLATSVGMAAPAKPTVLTLLTNGSAEYLESVKAFFQEFEKKNPDIHIDIQIGDLNKFVVQMAAGTPPDLVRLYGQTVPEYAAQGMLMDLTERLQASRLVPVRDLVPVIVRNSLSYRGRIYAIPFGVSVSGFFFNKTLFDEAGAPYPDKTWRWEVEGIQHGKKLTRDTNGDGIMDRFFMQFTAGYEAYPFIYSAGGKLFSEDWSQFLANSEATRFALQFYHDLAYVHRLMPMPGERGGPFEFPRATAATIPQGSWYVTALQVLKVPFDWDVAYQPSLRGGVGTNIWPETPMAIPAGVKNPDLSWRVIEFIGSQEGQTLLTKLGLAMPPVRLSVARTAFMEQHPRLNTQALVELATLPLTQTLPTVVAQARSAFDQVIADVINNRASPAQALDAATPKIQAILNEQLKKLGEKAEAK